MKVKTLKFSLKNATCRKCNSWIGLTGTHCPNCGIIHPVPHRKRILGMLVPIFLISLGLMGAGAIASSFLTGLGSFLTSFAPESILKVIGGVMGACFGTAFWTTRSSENAGPVFKTFVTGLMGFIGYGVSSLFWDKLGAIGAPALGGLFGFAAGMFLGSFVEKIFWGEKSKESLIVQKQQCHDRIKEIDVKIKEIRDAISILNNAKDLKTDRQKKRGETLQLKNDAALELKKKYKISIKKMALVRWGWGLQRLTVFLETINYDQCKERLKLLERLKADGLRLLERWRNDEDMTTIEEGKYNIKMLEDGIATCDSWLAELRDKLAELAAGTISKLTSIDASDSANLATEEFNHFLSMSRSTELFSAQSELEGEYQRLKLDDDAAKDLAS
ncbi:MAG: hypothetical protein GY757_49620, partial [bacterium]|nr:hypothetical protein [bacterium]